MSAGCIEEKPQAYWEQNAAHTVIHYLNIYDARSPGVAKTNMGQIMTNVDDRPYPIELHRELLRFGKNAGFTNSFYEKYIFVPSGMTNLVKQGRPLLMNSKPFRDQENRQQRYVIYETVWLGEPTYAYAPVPEEFVLNAFKEAKVTIPDPPRFPPAPRISQPPRVSFDRKVHDYFRRLALQLGMSGHHGRILEYIAGGVGGASSVVVIVLAARWATRRRDHT